MSDRKKKVFGRVPADSGAGRCCNEINTFLELRVFCGLTGSHLQDIEAKWDHNYNFLTLLCLLWWRASRQCQRCENAPEMLSHLKAQAHPNTS